MSDDEIKVRRRKLTDYKPDSHNANKGSERGQAMIEHSLRDYGAGRSILSSSDDVLLAGNKTQEGAIAAGIEEVIEIETDGRQLVVVKRKDLPADDERSRILAYLDNRSNQLSLTWAAGVIMKDFKDGVDLTGIFSQDELMAFMGEAIQAEEVPDAQHDKINEIHAKWNAAEGDLWTIPSKSLDGITHRLFCGDSTSEDAAKAALGSIAPGLMVTDPPYGVNYEAEWRDQYDKERGRNVENAPRSSGRVLNDDRIDWSDAFRLFPGDVMYVWHAGVYAGEVAVSLTSCGFQIRVQIIWEKQHVVMSRGHYHWMHEPCWYAVRKGSQANWHGDRKQATVWEVPNLSATQKAGSDETATGHGTQKPVEVMRRPIINHTLPGEYVYEPFCGSGTTICAAESVSRGCVAIELHPPYVSLTLQRLSDMGLSPVKA